MRRFGSNPKLWKKLSRENVFLFSSQAQLNFLHVKSKSENCPRNLIVLHGLLGSHLNFRSIVSNAKISSLTNSFLIDLRNHGYSDHMESMTLDDLAGDIMGFIKENNLKNLTLMGHSLGGKVVMKVLASHPELHSEVDGAIVADIAPINYVNPDLRIYNTVMGNLEILRKLSKLDLKKPADQIKSDLLAIASGNAASANLFFTNVVPTDIMRSKKKAFSVPLSSVTSGARVIDNVKPSEKSNDYSTFTDYVWRVNMQSICNNYHRLIGYFPFDKKYPGPAMVLKGEFSHYVPAEKYEEFSKVFEDFKAERDVKVIKRSGHLVHFENPSEFIALLEEFLIKTQRTY